MLQVAGKEEEPFVYLDNAGAPLPDKRMLASIFEELTQKTPLANPHAGSTMSRRTDEMVARTRSLVLSYLNVDEGEYELVFTAGSTASMKVGLPFLLHFSTSFFS
jgi:molybdenum cofactor sulfurtransferase